MAVAGRSGKEVVTAQARRAVRVALLRVAVLLPRQVVAAEAGRRAAEVAAAVLRLVARAGVAQVHRAVRVGAEVAARSKFLLVQRRMG